MLQFLREKRVDRLAVWLHEALYASVEKEAKEFDNLSEPMKDRYKQLAKYMINNPPPGFKKV